MNELYGQEAGDSERGTLHRPSRQNALVCPPGFLGAFESLSFFAPVSAGAILVALHQNHRAADLARKTGGDEVN